MIRSRVSWLVLAAALAAPAAFASEEHGTAAGTEDLDLSVFVPGAAELEGRIIAPCCWNQTIDIHGSPASAGLRREIRARLTAGESAEAIEKSLVDRYGAKILAVPSGSRLGKTGVILAIVMGSAGVGAVMMLRRWQQRSAASSVTSDNKEPPARDALDDRLDAELSRLE